MSVTAEKATIQVSFPKDKLDAIKFYMDEKDTTVEKELQGYIKSIYEKYVPSATRRYLDRNDSREELLAEISVSTEEPTQESATRATGTRGRRRNAIVQTEEANEALEVDSSTEQEEVQQQSDEESHGMTMSM